MANYFYYFCILFSLIFLACPEIEEGVPLTAPIILIVRSQPLSIPNPSPSNCNESIMWTLEPQDENAEIIQVEQGPNIKVINNRCQYFTSAIVKLGEWEVTATNGQWTASCGPKEIVFTFEGPYMAAKFVIDDEDCFGFDVFSFGDF